MHAVAAAIGGPASECFDYSGAEQPRREVLIDDLDCGQGGAVLIAFQIHDPGQATRALIESDALRPWASKPVQRHRRMDDAWADGAGLLCREPDVLKVARPAVGVEHIRAAEQPLDSPRAIKGAWV